MGKDSLLASQGVEVVGPRLHHRPSSFEFGGPVVGGAEGVADGVGKLVFDEVEGMPQDFIGQSPERGPEAVLGVFRA